MAHISKAELRAAGAMNAAKKIKEAKTKGLSRRTKRVGLHSAEFPGRYDRPKAEKLLGLYENESAASETEI